MLLWRVYFGDGATFSSDDGSPYDAPRLNVMCVVGPDKWTGRYTVSDKDAYWWVPAHGRWYGGDRRGEWDYLAFHPGPCVVIYGRAVSDEQYNLVIAAAETDPDFPMRTAWARGERIVD